MSEVPPGNGLPDEAAAQIQLVVSLASAGDLASAMARASQIRDRTVAAEAWRRLSEINANKQRWAEALSDVEKALQFVPDSRRLRLSRALLLEQLGDDRAALAEFEWLARGAADSPELLGHLAAQLATAGRGEDAEAALTRGLRQWPVDGTLHAQLARLLWQRGLGMEALRPIMRAIELHPQALHLLLVAAGLLRNAGDAAAGLELLDRGLKLAPDSATFRTSMGALLEDLDRVDEAFPYLLEARRRAPRSVTARRNLVPALLRNGQPREARALCEELLMEFPDEQMLIAQRATALRLLDDPEYRRLYDYERLVKVCMLRPVAPFAGIGEFNRAFAAELAPLHRARHHPLEQSLRGGSQTERHLPRDAAAVAAFFAMLDAPIREYMRALRGDASHPVDRRNSGDYRISGSWSVQLQAGGFHTNHVHPRGWLSSAYYVNLPDVSDADSRAGWLKFGEPGIRLPACGPEHFVQPAAGMLVLFPSYLWHGTVAFATGGPRLTAAFDVLPA